MWEPITKFIETNPQITLSVMIIYVAATAVVAAVRWLHSAYFEAKKDYLIKLAAYCEDVSDIGGRIAGSNYYPNEQIEKFWVYYYGKLVLVEDEKLETVMVNLGNILVKTTQQNYAEQRADIEGAVLAVSGACRDLVKRSWRLAIVPWKDLQAKRLDHNQDRAKKQLEQKENVTSK